MYLYVSRHTLVCMFTYFNPHLVNISQHVNYLKHIIFRNEGSIVFLYYLYNLKYMDMSIPFTFYL